MSPQRPLCKETIFERKSDSTHLRGNGVPKWQSLKPLQKYRKFKVRVLGKIFPTSSCSHSMGSIGPDDPSLPCWKILVRTKKVISNSMSYEIKPALHFFLRTVGVHVSVCQAQTPSDRLVVGHIVTEALLESFLRDMMISFYQNDR